MKENQNTNPIIDATNEYGIDEKVALGNFIAGAQWAEIYILKRLLNLIELNNEEYHIGVADGYQHVSEITSEIADYIHDATQLLTTD